MLKFFLNKQKINYPIASASGLPVPYNDPRTIPTTFFIDRKGIIQSIVVGYHDFGQLKSLALAEDFQGEPKAQPETPPVDLKEREKMLTPTEVWSNNVPGAETLCVGDWDADGRLDILVADSSKKLHVFGSDGVKKLTVLLPEHFSTIECGQDKQKGARLLGYSKTARKISVMDRTGKEVWHYSAGFGADGAHWGDLDGDGTDEMIIGMNGFGGLHAVASDGKKLWKNTAANVWGQAVVAATTNRPATVLATELMGSVRLFDGQGQLLRTVRPGGDYCTKVAAMLVHRGGEIQALALGQERVIAFDANGHMAWSAPVAQNSTSWVEAKFTAGDADGDGTNEWAFVDSAGDLVLASPAGEKIGVISKFQGGHDFVFVPDGAKGQFVTLSSGVLKAFRFESAH
jgi:hypothetical protein